MPTIGVETTSIPTSTSSNVPVTSPAETASTSVPKAEYQIPDGAALSEPGPYGVGRAQLIRIDESRGDRTVRLVVYYPALTDAVEPVRDAVPDFSAAPYPVVVADNKVGLTMRTHLASHGFVFIEVQGQSTWFSHPSPLMIDQPLDLVVGLDAVDDLIDHPLAEIADAERAGVVGYSFGSWNALTLAGARVDPHHYEATCAVQPDSWSSHWWGYICSERNWNELVNRATEVGVATETGLWWPLGDGRIRAAMPMGPEGFDLTGPKGLASVTVPVLLVAAGDDKVNDYRPAATSLFEHLPDADLITFVGADHFMIFEEDAVSQMRRFALAFFGLHLRQEQGFARFLTEEFIDEASGYGEPEAYDRLIWGVAGADG